MTLYTRHQLLLVLLIVGAAGAGLAIDHWRRASPDAVERLERIDRVERPAPEPGAPRDAARARPAPRTPREPAARVPREPAAREARRAPRDMPGRERASRESSGDAATPQAPLDVNRASVPELTRLPGVGAMLAARIVEARPFAALEDLARVPGLHRRTLERLRPLVATLPP
ncbi:MAG TPA: helix-hairpin-helix domain-containing protein [Candidatus Binatia bacterium]|nr:helix-hairpin-helix domain-containing protein [Candidatus Binatia bacterium]